jgi:hypothetical protein
MSMLQTTDQSRKSGCEKRLVDLVLGGPPGWPRPERPVVPRRMLAVAQCREGCLQLRCAAAHGGDSGWPFSMVSEPFSVKLVSSRRREMFMTIGPPGWPRCGAVSAAAHEGHPGWSSSMVS